MLKLFIFFLLLPNGNAQPAQAERKAEHQQAASQSSAASPNKSDAQVNHAANSASSSQSPQRDPEDDRFKTEQLRQSGVVTTATVWIAVFSGLSFVAVAVYAGFSYKQWKAIGSQAQQAEAQVRKMQGQLRMMKKQFDIARKSYLQTVKIIKQDRLALNEAKEQTRIMREAHIVNTRSYMDVFAIENINKERPAVVIKIGNIGAVPAEDIHGFIDVLFSKRKHSRTLLDIRRNSKRFPFDFQRTKLFRGKLKMKIQAPIYDEFLSPVEILNVFSGDADLVAQIMIEYRDGFSRDFRSETFAFRFDDEGGGWFTHPVPIQYSEIERKAVAVGDGLSMKDGVEVKTNKNNERGKDKAN